MKNEEVSFCYSKMVDIDVKLKGNKIENNNCDGCVYFDFCLKDIKVKSKDDSSTDENSSKPVITDSVTDSEVEKVSKPKVTKVKDNSSVTKKSKPKKETISDLLDEDIF